MLIRVIRPCAIVLVLSLFAASGAWGFGGTTSLTYSSGLYGYSETWVDPLDVGERECEYVDFGWYYCQGYNIAQVVVEARLYTPYGSADAYGYAINGSWAKTYFAASSQIAGTWTAVGDHSVDVWYFYEYCLPYQGCGSTYEFRNEHLGQTGAQEYVPALPCPRSTEENELASNFQVRGSSARFEYSFSIQNSTFSYDIVGYSPSTERQTLSSYMNAWNGTTHNTCASTFTVMGNVALTTNPIARLWVQTADEITNNGNHNCGLLQVQSQRDVITVVTLLSGPAAPPICYENTSLSAQHELGHLLGFEFKNPDIHAVQDQTDIMYVTISPQMEIKPRHARILVEEYSDVLQ